MVNVTDELTRMLPTLALLNRWVAENSARWPHQAQMVMACYFLTLAKHSQVVFKADEEYHQRIGRVEHFGRPQ